MDVATHPLDPYALGSISRVRIISSVTRLQRRVHLQDIGRFRDPLRGQETAQGPLDKGGNVEVASEAGWYSNLRGRGVPYVSEGGGFLPLPASWACQWECGQRPEGLQLAGSLRAREGRAQPGAPRAGLAR